MISRARCSFQQENCDLYAAGEVSGCRRITASRQHTNGSMPWWQNPERGSTLYTELLNQQNLHRYCSDTTYSRPGVKPSG